MSARDNIEQRTANAEQRTERRFFRAFGVRCYLLIAVLAASSVRAGNVSTDTIAAFEGANRLYEQSEFVDAAAAYQRLLDSGCVSPAILFNLGNALFKSGQVGRAVASYRQAELLAPRDPDVLANLQFARNQVQGPSWRIPAWQRWFARLTLNEWTMLAAVPFWLWLVGLAAGQARPGWRPALRTPIIVAGAVTAVACVAVAGAGLARQATPSAIVDHASVVVHNGPLDESPTVFTAHDGAELRVLDRKDDWLEVSAGDRNIGWVKDAQVVVAGANGKTPAAHS